MCDAAVHPYPAPAVHPHQWSVWLPRSHAGLPPGARCCWSAHSPDSAGRGTRQAAYCLFGAASLHCRSGTTRWRSHMTVLTSLRWLGTSIPMACMHQLPHGLAWKRRCRCRTAAMQGRQDPLPNTRHLEGFAAPRFHGLQYFGNDLLVKQMPRHLPAGWPQAPAVTPSPSAWKDKGTWVYPCQRETSP